MRDQLHSAIQASAAGDEELDGAVLMGWVVVAEWMSPNGSRWLSKVDGNAMGEPLPDWTVKGLLHDQLFSQEYVIVDGADEEEAA